MRGGRRRRGEGGGETESEGGGGRDSFLGVDEGGSRGEGVNRRRRQASFLIKTDHSHQP